MTAADHAAAIRLPDLDEVGPVLCEVLDEDEAMSAFQVLAAHGYQIVVGDDLTALLAELEAAIQDRDEALRGESDREVMLRAKLEAAREREASVERELRREWWLHHGHDYHALYGDDGEMSCGMCFLDFKRMPLEELRKALLVVHAKRINEALDAGEAGSR